MFSGAFRAPGLRMSAFLPIIDSKCLLWPGHGIVAPFVRLWLHSYPVVTTLQVVPARFRCAPGFALHCCSPNQATAGRATGSAIHEDSY